MMLRVNAKDDKERYRVCESKDVVVLPPISLLLRQSPDLSLVWIPVKRSRPQERVSALQEEAKTFKEHPP